MWQKDLEFTPFLLPSPALWPGVLKSEWERSPHVARWYRCRSGRFLMEQNQVSSCYCSEPWKIVCAALQGEGLQSNNHAFFQQEWPTLPLAEAFYCIFWVYWSWGKMHLWLELEWIITIWICICICVCICVCICIKWLWEHFSKRGCESVPKGKINSFPLWGQQDFVPFCGKLAFQPGGYTKSIESWALEALQLILISTQMHICEGQYLPLMVPWTVFVQEKVLSCEAE